MGIEVLTCERVRQVAVSRYSAIARKISDDNFQIGLVPRGGGICRLHGTNVFNSTSVAIMI
jgi:hypothetical protein